MEDLSKRSGEAADSSHPAMFPLLKARDAGSGASGPSMRHDEEMDWWILEGRIKISAGGEEQDLPLAAVVAGVAKE